MQTELCRFNGLGCGKEDNCRRSTADATENCKTFIYLETLEENFDDNGKPKNFTVDGKPICLKPKRWSK